MRQRSVIFKSVVMVALVAGVSAVTLAIVLWVAFGGDHDRYCESSDCRYHKKLITGALNWSIDPCEDFSAFVCSAWRATAGYRRGSRSSLEDVVTAWTGDFESMLRKGGEHLEVGKKALSMLALCREMNPEQVAARTEVLRKFMAERQIPWPGEALPNTRPLTVLVDLAFNWGVPLWFRVRFLRDIGDSKRAVRISPNGRVCDWLSLHSGLLKSGRFHEYWKKHYQLLAPAGYVPTTTAQSEKAAKVQIAVLEELRNAGERLSTASFFLQNMTRHTPSIPSDEWMTSLNESLRVKPFLTAQDQIIFTHVALLAALNKIILQYTREEILASLAWLFVQMVAPIVDPTLPSPRVGQAAVGPKGNLVEAQSERFAFCASTVEAAYRFLVISLYTVSNFHVAERQNIDKRLRAIRGVAVEKVKGMKWMALLSKARAEEKFNKSKTLLWPSEDLQSSAALSAMHSGFPESDDNFAALWLRVRKSVRELYAETTYDEALNMPSNLALPLVDYDYVLNRVRISVQALSPPVYYAQGTKAMFYGGLGFLYASKLVGAVDAEGMRVDAHGRVYDLWMQTSWRDAVLDRERCSGSKGGYFPEIPALEISYGAFEQELGKGSVRHQLLRDGLSERQQFFVTLCFHMCSRDATKPTGDCNKAVMNFPPFANEFSCTQYPTMNTSNRCLFFAP
ncbi:hypothetical protein HPB48_026884 [Haemaphysalis longicornis]|uniref:Peptidase M13 N-terminal domain-containing protein n=1 Tax=Haemaphysalis longicornis TaxID=44386 RepID=A0A9J6H282_HAELO|nr:hypothetical protein HPB48_026884 [Haemaphysalis longicornis]